MSYSRVRRLVLLSALVASLAVAALGAVHASALSLIPGEEVAIDTGTVKGAVGLDHRAFLGIPFAASTAGAGRFRVPRAASPWTGVRDATRSGPSCAQPILPSTEDCLTVDVYTPPVASGSNLPVLVWIYGGAYVLGSTSGYDPMPLVKNGVIVVEVNYRLGAFGFLSLPGLDTESGTGTSGDYALMDQQAGLRWVQRNIASFGGDRHNVTIFGESAGGNSVCHQVASPLSAGLFQRAIVQSGACSGRNGLTPVSRAEMQRRSRTFARELGCTDPATEVTCLRDLPQSTLLSSKTEQFQLDLTWVPSIDGSVVPRSLEQAWRTGRYQKVPMIVGGTHDEGRTFVFLEHVQTRSRVTAQAYQAWVRATFGGHANAVLAKYPVSAFPSPDLAKATVLTDSSFSCAAERHIAQLTTAGSRVYTYELNDVDPPLAGTDPFMPLGNFHGSDVLYLMNSLQGIPANRDAARQRLSNQMTAAWTTFARTGRPGTVGDSGWPAWTSRHPRTIEFSSAGNRLTTGVAADHNCGFWAPIIG